MAITQRVILPGGAGSPLERLAKGLSIAQSVYGIKTAFQQDELNKIRIADAKAKSEREALAQTEKTEKEDFARRGGLTPAQRLKVSEVEPGTKGARTGLILDPSGEEREFTFKTAVDVKKDLDESIRLAKKEADSAEDEIKATDRMFSKANKLGERFDKASKVTSQAIEGLQKIEAAASNPKPTGATDMSLLFGFMKSIDPTSVVRESEFRTAAERMPIPERISVLRDKLLSGDILTPAQRQRFLVEGQRAVFNQLQTQAQINDRFRGIAQSFEIPEDLVIDARFEQLAERLRGQTEVVAGLLPDQQQPIAGQRQPVTSPTLQRAPQQRSLIPDNLRLGTIFGGGRAVPQPAKRKLNDRDFINDYLNR